MNVVYDPTDELIVKYLTTVLSERLRIGESVLWLVPGGSAMKVATQVLEGLEDEDTSRLCITLTDERYGRPDHEHENWSQLARLGFSVRSINAYRVLRGEDADTTAAEFSQKLAQLFATYEYKIGLFGIGADGHTAGIKPHAPAVDSGELASYFAGEDHERVTMTPKAIMQLDEAVVYAHGSEKHPVLYQLVHENRPLMEQPAQVLKNVQKVTVFCDWQNATEE